MPSPNASSIDSTTPEAGLADLEAMHPLSTLASHLTGMWGRGWQPLDVARLIGTRLPTSLALYSDCLSLDRLAWHARAASLWHNQADQLGAGAPWWDTDRPYWPQFIDRHRLSVSQTGAAASWYTLAVDSTAELPLLEAPPTQPGWSHGAYAADDNVLAKVRGLLAKAESTQFDHEAEALSAKAQQLIARHSIDLALLADEVDIPGGRRVYLDSPYTTPKFMLLANIADANGCRACWNKSRQTASLIGHQGDMHLSEMLFTSLLLQGTGAVLAAGAQSDGFGGSTTRSWRNAFWYGYANRIGQRLREAAQVVVQEHQASTGEDLLPVLASRADAVEEAFDSAFPKLGKLRGSISNDHGFGAGHVSADRADLSSDHKVTRSKAAALPR